MRSWPALLTTLAAVVLFDVALIVGDERRPEPITVTRPPIGELSRAAPRGGAATIPGTTPAAPVVTCTTPAPSPTWVCQNNVWMMVATSTPAGAAGSSPASGAGGGAGNCPGAQPGAEWTCRAGVWTSAASTSSTAPSSPEPPTSSPNVTPPGAVPPIELPPSQTTCTAPNPASGMPGVTARCVNGTWVLGG